MNIIAQNLRAPNDIDGNPRRLWVAYSSDDGDPVAVYDEGYSGDPFAGTKRVTVSSVEISAGEYTEWRWFAKVAGIWHD